MRLERIRNNHKKQHILSTEPESKIEVGLSVQRSNTVGYVREEILKRLLGGLRSDVGDLRSR